MYMIVKFLMILSLGAVGLGLLGIYPGLLLHRAGYVVMFAAFLFFYDIVTYVAATPASSMNLDD